MSTSADQATSPLDGPHAEGHAHLDPHERAAALETGAPRVPRNFVLLAALVAVVLGLGGTLVERLASATGLNPSPGTAGAPAPTLRGSMASFLDLARLPGAPAPPVSLTDATGAPVTLRALRGRVVVLSFFDADCKDACGVLAAEISAADALLGARRSHVAFVTVNADPLALGATAASPAVSATGLGALANWRFLSGTLPAVDAVWRRYGVAISVYPRSGLVVHNNVMYFIDPAGRLELRTSPVVNESPSGIFSLPSASIRRSAEGIAAYASGLLGASR